MKNRFLFVLICIGFFFQSCGSKEDIVPQVSFYKGNVLLPNITFQTDEQSEVLVEYWPQDKHGRVQKSIISKGANHNLILLNLKQSTRYNYLIKNIKTNKKSDVFSFETGALPFDIVTTKKTLIDTSLFKGFILIRKLAPRGSDVIVDNEGDVVWYHLYDTAVRRPFTWTGQKSILSIYDSGQVVEYNLFGDNVLNLRLKDFGVSNMLHHEVLFNNKKEIVSLTLDSAKMDLRKLGGGANQSIRADGIIVLSIKGEKIWEWNLLDVYDPIKSPTRKIDLKQSLGHANSMAIDKDGHYVVSFREFSQIWKINSVDGSIIWKLGKNGDFIMDEKYHFTGQHSIHFNEQGELMMFDNGDKSGKQNSRALSFQLDENTMKAVVNVDVVLPLELSAFKMCSAELISSGKYLICTSKKNGIISIVNDKAEILWRVDLTNPSYRAYYLSNPFSE